MIKLNFYEYFIFINLKEILKLKKYYLAKLF